MRLLKSRLLWTTATAFLLLNTVVEIPQSDRQSIANLNIQQEAYAKKSGGRSGGGSFSRPSRSNSGSSSPSRSNNNGGSSGGSYYNSTPVYGGGYRSGGVYFYPGWGFVFPSLFGVMMLMMVLFIIYAIQNSRRNSAQTTNDFSTGNKELDNNIVTISKIQVGLLAQARAIQKELSELSLSIDTGTPDGLSELVQESVLALLRSPENWTHVSATSQTVRTREEAETIFNKFSIEERSKFSSETLTNVEGKVRQKDVNPNPNAEPGSYIVVTLLIGTEDDRPLFVNVYSSADLKAALERIGGTASEYLTVFELLWTPQSETESLTYDELLSEYANLMQIV
ncbi:DUF1517 domain-containing protein [Argonema antarcticum]|uniref:DUF1517 domain-containing protein n=1 Tax=Argonema antarcticum TaxID=2942763 RepID=UPI0020112623|nr:DUF1517 domain-containing protein [Argonema antarcticum]MCL1475956.1 DUF1517 domain-containing protein [Argonema antarcticum A004/B2]